MNVHDPYTHDVVLVGGGLQNGLIALACLQQQPTLRIALIEREDKLGGNHTWCMHGQDVPEAARAFVEPLIEQRYDRYDVRFPGYARTVPLRYEAISSARFDRVLQDAFGRHAGAELYLRRSVRELDRTQVLLDDGSTLSAPLVIDSRGPARVASEESDQGYSHAHLSCGFQKFVGLELRFDAPHALAHPILMDATVPQDDGFRFFYVLPLGADRLLVEDTAFSRSPRLDKRALTASVLDYARRFGNVAEIAREEHGVLPMPWSSARAVPAASPIAAGYQGGLFHPATGYSLPVALRFACFVAERAPHAVLGPALASFHARHRSQARYAELLNALLFHAFAPEDMWRVFARFYRLPDGLIERFYALSLSVLDRARILIGKPVRGFSLLRLLAHGRMPRATRTS
jgi:lycopene beta-cyclase